MRTILRRAVLAGVALLLGSGLAQAAELKLISVGGVADALKPIVADYTKTTGNQVSYTVTSPAALADRLKAGEAFDVVVQSVPAMEDYAKAGGVKEGTRVRVARGGIGIAIRQGAAAPDLATVEAFKAALTAASSVAVTSPKMPNGSGMLAFAILADAGLIETLQSKLKIVGLDPGQEQIAKGEIALGLFNLSEIRASVQVAGPVPAALQRYTEYEVALPAKGSGSDAAVAFAKMLASPASAAHWKAARLEPQGN